MTLRQCLWAATVVAAAAALVACPVFAAEGPGQRGETLPMWTDPVTRYLHISYDVPPDAPDEVVVVCCWSSPGGNDWRPARVSPLISETALRLLPDDEWEQWARQGRIVERRAAGLTRTVVFDPYPEAQRDGRVDVDFRIVIQSPDGAELATHVRRVQADNSDVVYIEDWSQVLQGDALAAAPASEDRKWAFRTGQDASAGATRGDDLYGRSPADLPLPQLTYPLDLRGTYAIFVCTAPHYGLRLRLTGDERADLLSSPRPSQEVLWRWRALDRQHLVLGQPHGYTGYTAAEVDYVKLVPLADDVVADLDARFGGKHDKTVAGYFEPYSWAFAEDVRHALQHREPLTAFAEAGLDIVDIQIGRFGARVVYESRRADQLLYSTIGDPIGEVAQPKTDNVGRMQQYTNALEAELRYARELGLFPHANFGASNCYPGTPLQGDFSRDHPDWMRGHALRFEVPEVQEHVLTLYREALEIGAPGLSLDFCRYPETVDAPATATDVLRKLRALADEFGERRGESVPILVRFPATGVRRWELFDYATWAREGLVDYLCPSNIQGRHHHFDVAPYLDAVRGTKCRLLPCVDGLDWGLPMPGPYLWRVRQLYEAGVDGIYVYQADARLLGTPEDRRCMGLLASSEAVARWWAREEAERPRRSKGIYITPYLQIEGYNGWERLRVWTEGLPPGKLEMHLDGQLVCRTDGPPYLLGTEDYASDRVIPPGDHTLLLRAQDGDGWLERSFTIHGAD